MSQTIAIVGGTGAEGAGLAWRWAAAGETIVIGSRDAGRAGARAAEIARRAPGARIEGRENAAAASAADVVVLTVPFSAQAATLKQLKGAIRPGAVVIDTTVPLAATIGGRATRVLGVWQGSAAEQAAELVPKGVAVAAAFHGLSAELLAGDGPVDCDVVVCSDDQRARELAMALAEKIPGVRAVDGGALEMARLAEQMTALLIALNLRYKVPAVGVRFTGLPVPDSRR
ncbi:MAG TPA: NADPH-dependent F420 reductase [Candidatus Acidoferrales bacterium]|nr:NADPH-dependent F420 reductase [Candidatus Acidoferrales bacterium]